MSNETVLVRTGGVMKDRYSFVIMALALMVLASTAFALPRFAAMNEQRCDVCHVNPTGCWMRNTYGAQFFAQTELSMHKATPDQMAVFKPTISDNFSIGMDLRTIYIYNKQNSQSTFFEMEGNLYFQAQVQDRFSMTLYKDVYSDFQAFGSASILPYQGYIKAGKFQPSYGWRFADHTSFVRERMLWPATYFDTGLEFGLYPSGVSANVGLFNGSGSMFDENKGKAVAARLELRRHIKFAGLCVGGSLWRNDQAANSISMYGPFYYVNLLRGRLVYLGEIGWLKDRRADSTSMATTQNAAFKVVPGVWIEAQYDFLDPDIHEKTGTLTRYGISLDCFPIAFMEIQPYLRYYDDSYLLHKKYYDLHTEIHFFF
jgi:hypothetical protein